MGAGAFTCWLFINRLARGTINVGVVDPRWIFRRPGWPLPAAVLCGTGQWAASVNLFEREQTCGVFPWTREKYLRHPLVQHFHGRDYFIAVAAALSNGRLTPEEAGNENFDTVSLPALRTRVGGQGRHAGGFCRCIPSGNCMTNFIERCAGAELA